MSDLRERLIALARDHPLYLDGDSRFDELAIQAARMAQENCIATVKRYLQHDTQRAVSWHEVQDCLEAMRKDAP